jgi:hypothetical protein
MGAPDRFEFGFTELFGVGIRFSRFPYTISIDFYIPFFRMSIGFGKRYTDNKTR